MIRLLVLRHARAVDRSESPSDFERPLAPAGEAQAAALGRTMGGQEAVPDTVLSSPAGRAIQTAEQVAGTAGWRAPIRAVPELYQADETGCLRVLAAQGGTSRCILLVGHNPAMERLASLLAGETVALGTCVLADLELDLPDWSELSAKSRGSIRALTGGNR